MAKKWSYNDYQVEEGLKPAEAVNPSTLFFCLFSEGICEGIVKGIGG